MEAELSDASPQAELHVKEGVRAKENRVCGKAEKYHLWRGGKKANLQRFYAIFHRKQQQKQKALAVPQDMISLFELNLLSALLLLLLLLLFFSAVCERLPCLSHKAQSLAGLFLCYIFIM